MGNSSITCLVCHCIILERSIPEMSSAGVTLCEVCNAPYHTDCWKYNGRCAVFGCEKVIVTPIPIQRPLPVRSWIDGWIENPPYRYWQVFLFATFLFLPTALVVLMIIRAPFLISVAKTSPYQECLSQSGLQDYRAPVYVSSDKEEFDEVIFWRVQMEMFEDELNQLDHTAPPPPLRDDTPDEILRLRAIDGLVRLRARTMLRKCLSCDPAPRNMKRFHVRPAFALPDEGTRK